MTERAQEMAKTAITREKFSFAAAVNDRAYPEIDVPIYLDEAAAREFVTLQKEREVLDAKMIKADALGQGKVASSAATAVAELEEKIDAVRDLLDRSRVVVRVRGVAPSDTDALRTEAFQAFPVEYDEVVSPITGAVTKTEKPNPERDSYYAALIRHAHIVSVTAPDGAEDSGFSVDELTATWSKLPIVARVKIDDAINDTVVSVDFYRDMVSPVF